MDVLDESIIEKLVSVLQNKLSIHEFENWLYDNDALLEKELGKNTYFDLVDINYKSRFAFDELEPLLLSILGYKSIDEFEIRETLKRLVISDEEDLINCCRKVYEGYCKGYSFFRIIALKFVDFDYDSQLDELKQRNKFIKDYRDELVKEAQRLLGFLETKKIEIVGPVEYTDLRNEEDKLEERYGS